MSLIVAAYALNIAEALHQATAVVDHILDSLAVREVILPALRKEIQVFLQGEAPLHHDLTVNRSHISKMPGLFESCARRLISIDKTISPAIAGKPFALVRTAKILAQRQIC